MKAYSFLVVMTLLLVASMVVMIGCEYDVAEPQWYKPFSEAATLRITQIEPASEAIPV